MKILVTAYVNPDLDGTACAYAYAEFLCKNGVDAVSAVFGEPHREAKFVFKKFDIPVISNAEKIIDNINEVILVDASDPGGISAKIDPRKVVEIIDHRKIHEAHKFPNAKVNIELVGSAATMIAEKFYQNKTDISSKSAALLYSAIVSNTINFQGKVTTKRDHQMADWLKTKFALPKNYIHEMFADKSLFKKSLKGTMDDDFAHFYFNNYHLGIAQLEIINVNNFVDKNLQEIKRILAELKKEKSLDFIFLNCIDLEKASNVIVVDDAKSQKILEKSLKLKFINGIARTENIIMRKELVPLLKKFLEKNPRH